MSVREAKKKANRERILVAAEKLIRKDDRIGFSMRALAEEAGVAFATPFNLFESKFGVLCGLLEKRIEAQMEQLGEEDPGRDPVERLFEQAALGSRMYLADPTLYKPILHEMSHAGPEAGRVAIVSMKFWSMALQSARDTGLISTDEDVKALARLLQLGFASVLYQWASGHLRDDELVMHSQHRAAVSLMAVMTDEGRQLVLKRVGSISRVPVR
ncbi:MAG TPA: TetR/AcrR family transcriptional regulator [Pseudomonadales bacterium]|nr:TetR/AcrR family transcriptional regulator [Pseudomonadales bacterium]